MRGFNAAQPVVHVEDDSALHCSAKGCPNRWSVNSPEGKLCTWHYRSPPHSWPQVTQEQQWAETERAMKNGAPPKPTPPVDRAAVMQKLRVFAKAFGRQDPKAWARLLKEREEAGEILNERQRKLWRSALGQVSEDA